MHSFILGVLEREENKYKDLSPLVCLNDFLSLKPTLFLYFHRSVGCHSGKNKKRIICVLVLYH